MAQVLEPPASIEVNGAVLLVSVATYLSVVVPSPSCPLLLLPQHITRESFARMAQVW